MTKNLAFFALGVAFGGLSLVVWQRSHDVGVPVFATPFQAVLLDSGQLYFGKVEGLSTEYPTLRDVYYIQTTTDPKTQQPSNVLIRRGKEWHGPDYMVLNAKHITMIEPVSPTSKVATSIAEQEKAK